MLDLIKEQLEVLLTQASTTVGYQAGIKNVISRIDRYNQENDNGNDMHRVFRSLEQYSNLYKAEVAKYMALEGSFKERIFQCQEILCVLTLLLSLVGGALRRYNTGEDKGAMGKYLRMLNEAKDMYRSEKISWTSTQKALSNLVLEDVESKKAKLFYAQSGVDRDDSQC